ncbi:MAG: pvaA 1 [Gemmataceae bacterium]|nr:pvaA 1 [Gemmataceae bacterium]
MRTLAAAVVAVWLAQPLSAADWPRFQGPNGDGTSPETGLLREWPKDGPRAVWRAKIKQGWGCPVVAGDDVYLGWTEEVRGEQEAIVCLDAKTGAERWRHGYEVGPYWKRNIGWAAGGYRSTPCVAGKYVYGLGAVGHLVCLDRATGKVVWGQNLWDEWNPSGEKGYSFSPVVEDGRLILWYSDGAWPVPPKGKEKAEKKHFVLCRALDPDTGKLIWEFKEPHLPSARMGEGQTPAVAAFGGEKCVVVCGNCDVKAIRVADGKQVWKYASVRPDGRGTTIPTPLVLRDHIVNIPDSDVSHVLRVNRDKPDEPAAVVWKKDLDTYTAVHQFRHRDGYLYGFAGTLRGDSEKAAGDSVLSYACIELTTGKVMWTKRGFKSGNSHIEADGLLFVRSYQTLRLIAATPTGYSLKGEVHTHDVWQTPRSLTDIVMPVLSRGRLYVRTPDELICYQVAAQ